MKYIFLLNMGGASNLAECKVFLHNMFADKNILRIPQPFRWALGHFIAAMRAPAMRKNYEQIGGKSRLNELQSSLCAKMQSLANSTANGAIGNSETSELAIAVTVDFISCYVPPFAADVLGKYRFCSGDEIVLLPLYPQFSTTTTRSSLQDFMRAFRAQITANVQLFVVPPFYKNPAYNELLAKLALQAKNSANADVLVISAHSLPESIARSNDPYEQQINEQFKLLKTLLSGHFSDIELAYQSRLGPVKWLGPSTAEVLARFKGQNVAVLPLSFCIDCSETDFELAIEYAHEHESSGGLLHVASCPNDCDAFAQFALELASEAIDLEEFCYE